MWLITLLILAIAAFFIVKYMKSQTQRKHAEQERLGQSSGIEGSLDQSASDSTQSAHAHNSPAIPNTRNMANNAPSDTQNTTGAIASGVAAAGAVAGTVVASSTLAQNSGDTLSDVREMIKILNLAEPDAKRLAISAEQLRALRNADESAIPSEQMLSDVAERLRKMLS